MSMRASTEQDFCDLIRRMDIPGFLVSEEISRFAQQLVREEMAGKQHWGDLKIPTDAKRHAQATAIALPSQDEIGGLAIFVLDEPDDEPGGSLESIVYEIFDGTRMHVGNFVAGGVMFVENRWIGRVSPKEMLLMSHTIATAAFVLSIINQPSIVRKDALLPRQQRRAAERSGAKAMSMWSRVTWDLSKEAVARASRDPGFHRRPLHWRRGHYRRAQPHYSGAVQRPDAIRPEEREMWWQWIDGQWVGHPAFGIRRSVHAPTMTSGVLARRHSA